MKLSKEEMAQKLVNLFPEKEQSLKEHYQDYGELLGHIFFADEICCPLFEMLKTNCTNDEIKKYCRFIEDMWLNGNDDVVNVVEVTILERLSDDKNVWLNFGCNLSNDFIRYINTEVLLENAMMWQVDRLEYNKVTSKNPF